MKCIRIRGPRPLFANLRGIAGLDLDHGDFEQFPDGEQALTADGTDDAIAVVQALGLTVEVLETEDEAVQHLAQLTDPDADGPATG